VQLYHKQLFDINKLTCITSEQICGLSCILLLRWRGCRWRRKDGWIQL